MEASCRGRVDLHLHAGIVIIVSESEDLADTHHELANVVRERETHVQFEDELCTAPERAAAVPAQNAGTTLLAHHTEDLAIHLVGSPLEELVVRLLEPRK